MSRNQRFEVLATAAVDGELDEAGRRELDEILARHPELHRELEEQRRIREVMGTMRFVQPSEEFWDHYRRGVLHRLERGIGWFLLALGAGLLLGYGTYQFFRSSDVDLWVKIGVTGCLAGAGVLLVSIVRERLFLRKRERYDEVQR